MIKIQKPPSASRPWTDRSKSPEARIPLQEQTPSPSALSAPVINHAATNIEDFIASQHQTAFALRPSGVLLHLAPSSPFRPLDHAWQVLLRWNEIRQLCAAWTAELPAGSVAFVKALRRCRDLDDHRSLKEELPAYYQAFWLWMHRPPELRWQVEARILARQSWETIAAKTGLTVESLILYERLFYHVTDRLDDYPYVLHEVIAWHHAGANRVGTIWQYYAYRGGPDVLDTFLYGYPSSRDPQTLAAVRKFLVEDFLDELCVRRMVCARFARHTPFGSPK